MLKNHVQKCRGEKLSNMKVAHYWGTLSLNNAEGYHK